MQEKSDAQLLREYAAGANEAAFREIVTRHADLVYASALRQVRSPELARDIAQTVFGHLVRKAPALGKTLADNASLVGWLYRTTRYETNTQMRDNRRRQARERQAMENLDTNSETTTEWERIAPVLDEAMADLSDEDREALLLRFFKNLDFRAIGVSLGVSDDAAQKRVSRALERLRAEFNRRGVTTTAVALATAVSANAVSAPAGLAATLSTAALTGATLTTTATATKAITLTTLQKTLVTATVAVLAGAGIYEARQASTLRTQVLALQQQQAPLAEQIQQMSKNGDETARQLAALRADNERLNRNTAELLRLRGEVGPLRRQIAETKAIQNGTTNQIQFLRGYSRREEWSDRGTDEPLHTILTMLWAIRQGDETKLEQLVSRAYASQQLDDLTLPKRDWDKLAGVQIVTVAQMRGGPPGGRMEDLAGVDTIVEKAPTADGEGKEVEVRRWSLVKTNDQWLIRLSN